MTKAPSPRPLSIKVLGGLFFAGGLFMCSALKRGAVIFGVEVSGWPAFFYNLVILILGLYLGIGLWRLDEAARKVAIGYQIFMIPNLLLLYMTYERKEPVPLLIWPISGLINVAGGVLIISFPVKRRSAFLERKRGTR